MRRRELRNRIGARGQRRAADDAGAGVHEIDLAARENGDGRSGAIGIGVRRSGPEHYNAGRGRQEQARCRFAGRKQRDDGEEEGDQQQSLEGRQL